VNRERVAAWGSWAGVIVASVGGCVLAGWVFEIEPLKAFYGTITMKTNAAIAFLLCGAALWEITHGRRTSSAIAAAAAAAIGGATLTQHLAGWDLRIDQLLFTETPGAAATASPNRMGPHGSTSIFVAGIALLLLRAPTLASLRAAQALAFAGLAASLVAITGYAYGATELFGIARFTGIALHTSLALFVLHSGILAAATRYGALGILVDEGTAGTLIRRLVVPVVLLPLLLGYLLIQGRESNLVDRGLSMATFAVSVIVLLLATIWQTAEVINTSDRERQRARDEAERANRLKDQFIAVLSHELRTPLNVMLGRLQLLEGEVDRETRIRASRIVARNGRLLARLVEDLLDLSRVAAGQFEIAPATVPVNALVKTVVDALTPHAAAKNVLVVSHTDAEVGTIQADPHRLNQVVTNLVSNAVKFTPAGGRIDVRTARGVGSVTITVTDSGIGFDREFASQLFQPFRQADPSFKREHGGLGLGLSIARHLVELHGGTISASSAGAGRGATFSVTLPSVPPRPETTDRGAAYSGADLSAPVSNPFPPVRA
jgi:signal transduction histidine kinase